MTSRNLITGKLPVSTKRLPVLLKNGFNISTIHDTKSLNRHDSWSRIIKLAISVLEKTTSGKRFVWLSVFGWR